MRYDMVKQVKQMIKSCRCFDVNQLVAPWMLMRILYCWIKERIGEHAQTP